MDRSHDPLVLQQRLKNKVQKYTETRSVCSVRDGDNSSSNEKLLSPRQHPAAAGCLFRSRGPDCVATNSQLFSLLWKLCPTIWGFLFAPFFSLHLLLESLLFTAATTLSHPERSETFSLHSTHSVCNKVDQHSYLTSGGNWRL